VRITKQTVYKIDKILDKRFRRGSREYIVRWQGYSKEFDSWIPASSVRTFKVDMNASSSNHFTLACSVTLRRKSTTTIRFPPLR